MPLLAALLLCAPLQAQEAEALPAPPHGPASSAAERPAAEPVPEPTLLRLPAPPATLPTASQAVPLPPRGPAEVLPLEPSVESAEQQADGSDAATPPIERSVAAESGEIPLSAYWDQAIRAGPPALIPQGDPSSVDFIGPPLVAPFKLLGEEVASGSRRSLAWNAGQSFAGGDTVVPVNVVHGTRPGPILCLTAAVHGDEINGVEIARRVFNGLDPDRLSGTVIAVPIVNLFGFARNSRYLPDRRDLNRFFPGNQFGSVASRLAFGFFHNVVKRCDALVDFHTGSFDRDNLPQVRADLRLPEVLRFSRGFGALPVLHSNGSKGMLRVAASQAGIPAATFEVGAPGIIQIDQVERAEQAIDALMHHLGMIPDQPLAQEPQAIFYASRWVRANAGGLLIADVALGDRVRPEQRLGVIIDPVRNAEREILSPVFGRIIGMARNQVVLPGFAAFHIGEETSAEQASDAATAGYGEEVEEDPDPARDFEPDP
jgi:predicted deacylase